MEEVAQAPTPMEKGKVGHWYVHTLNWKEWVTLLGYRQAAPLARITQACSEEPQDSLSAASSLD